MPTFKAMIRKDDIIYTWRRVSLVRGQAEGNLLQQRGKASFAELSGY